ncbi:low specificity L-threonine aldolase [Elysia marginata]|uniref:Low specificity L-threonine aldolase n=1 Tax=Elysia marginata TaxID=1093978 RepID=A0AAV4GYA9_9GAST|nr:low specificity L-threonine aldolase [Elysia marginata]
MLGRGVEKSNCHATVSRVSLFQVDIGQAVFDLMGNLADGNAAMARHLLRHLTTTKMLRNPEVYCKASSWFSSSTTPVVDLRSDTLTTPTPRMREAMKNAVVGDDVYREDPTVNRLEEMAADILGKEAALLVPTCTMANTAAILVHCDGRFNEVICGDQSHIHVYEVAAIAQFGGVQSRFVQNQPDGTMDIEQIREKIRPLDDEHQPWTRAICVENTHNRCGGKVLSLEYMKQVRELSSAHNLVLHLDGARLFNAATALNVRPSEITQYCDSVSTAFSKGLCCPLGSIVAGPQHFIAMARRARKALGGGMRQAGVVAAPMIVALEEMMGRLSEDHRRARTIAEAVNAMGDNPVCKVTMSGVHSNIFMLELDGVVTPEQLSQRMQHVTDQERKSLGEVCTALMFPFSKRTVRIVTHNNITDSDVDIVSRKLQYVIEEMSV